MAKQILHGEDSRQAILREDEVLGVIEGAKAAAGKK